MDNTIIAALITVIGGLITALLVHWLNSRSTPVQDGDTDETILENTLRRSKRGNVTTDWIEKRTGWDEPKVLAVANSNFEKFHVGTTATTGRSFIKLKP